MRFELTGDWPVSWPVRSQCIPAGTIIYGAAPEWAGIQVPMPITAKALDVEAANALVEQFPFHQDRLMFAPGIKPTVSITV